MSYMKRINELERELALLKIKQKQAHGGRLLSSPRYGEAWQAVGSDIKNGFTKVTGVAGKNKAFSRIAFYEDVATQYCDALNTLFLLRKCKGSQPAKDKVRQYFITPFINSEGVLEPRIYSAVLLRDKLLFRCVWFDSPGSAKQAIDAVGQERVSRMILTLVGIFKESVTEAPGF